MIKPIDWNDDPIAILKELQRVLSERLTSDNLASPMDEYTNGLWFSPEVNEALEEVLLPAIEYVIDRSDIDPTPDTLWGNSGGEPPVTSKEIDLAAWKQHVAMYS